MRCRRPSRVKLRSTAGTGCTYVTSKNRRHNPDQMTLRKYDPIVRRHVTFREERGCRRRVCGCSNGFGVQVASSRAAAWASVLDATTKIPAAQPASGGRPARPEISAARRASATTPEPHQFLLPAIYSLPSNT